MTTAVASTPPVVSTPPRKYPFLKKSDGSFYVPLSPKAKKVNNFIYRIKNHTSGTSYVGKCSNRFAKNVSRYVSAINNPAKDTTKFGADVRAGETFTIGILYKIKPGEDINQEEVRWIKQKKLVDKLYNITKGGNGGRSIARAASTKKITAATMDALFRKVYKSPERKIRLFKKMSPSTSGKKKPPKQQHSIKLATTFTPLKKQNDTPSGVYKITQVTEHGRKLEYVGKATNLKNRISTHIHYANNPSKKQAAENPLYKAIHTAYEEFYISEIDTQTIRSAVLKESGVDPTKEDIEASAIRVLQTQRHGYNRVAGSNINVQNTKTAKRKLFE